MSIKFAWFNLIAHIRLVLLGWELDIPRRPYDRDIILLPGHSRYDRGRRCTADATVEGPRLLKAQGERTPEFTPSTGEIGAPGFMTPPLLFSFIRISLQVPVSL